MKDQPERRVNAAETIELHRRLRVWARQAECGTVDLVGDLTEIHAAAREIADSIEFLARVPPPTAAESGKALVNLSAWINDELMDHIGSLNARLANVISRLYESE